MEVLKQYEKEQANIETVIQGKTFRSMKRVEDENLRNAIPIRTPPERKSSAKSVDFSDSKFSQSRIQMEPRDISNVGIKLENRSRGS